jgi:hypothetical protein
MRISLKITCTIEGSLLSIFQDLERLLAGITTKRCDLVLHSLRHEGDLLNSRVPAPNEAECIPASCGGCEISVISGAKADRR